MLQLTAHHVKPEEVRTKKREKEYIVSGPGSISGVSKSVMLYISHKILLCFVSLVLCFPVP